jgi:hypothetical protein
MVRERMVMMIQLSLNEGRGLIRDKGPISLLPAGRCVV